MRLLLLVVAVLVAVAVVIIYSYYTQQERGLFKGAYAVYNGSWFLGFIAQNVSIRAEVVDFNSTHVLVKIETTTISAIYLTFSPETTVNKTVEEQWFPRNIFSNLTYRGEEEEYVEFLKTVRKCRVYVNSSDTVDIIYYVDKKTNWPVKIVISVKQFGMQIPLTLVDSNIFKK